MTKGNGQGAAFGGSVGITGLGTALPPYLVDQDTVAARVASLQESERSRRFVRWLFRRSRIEARPFAIPDALDPSRAVLYGTGPLGLSERMRVFRREAPHLAIAAAREALKAADTDRDSITHLVVVTSTGVYTPGLDVDVALGLGLAPSVHRSLVSMMGCAGAFHGIRIARRIAESDRRAVALVVCAEICSIHLDRESDPGQVVASSLFGDAAAAVVIESRSSPEDALALLGLEASHLEPRYRSALEWTLGDRGFELRLGKALPRAIAEVLPGFMSNLSGRAAELGEPPCPGWWAVHPGGDAILGKVEESLELPPAALDQSRSVLRQLGNLSSAAVLFVLDRALSDAKCPQRGILLGFGPGLSVEAILASRGGRRHRSEDAS